MNVAQFNQTIAREKITAPADAEVRIIEFKDGEVKVEVLGKTTWVKARKTSPTKPQRTWAERYESERPSSSIDKDELALSPSEFKLLYWIRSLEHPNFSGQHAAKELGMSDRNVRKCLRELRSKGMIAGKVLQ